MPADKNAVRAVVSIRDILTLFGLEPNRHGKLCCPFHSEKTPSMKIYDDSNSFYCFGCGAGGTIFDFVMQINNCNFQTAHDLICTAFNIPNSTESTPEQKKAITDRRKQAEERKERKEYGWYAWNRLCAYRHYLIDLQGYAPEKFHNLDYLNYIMDEYTPDLEKLAQDIPDIDNWLRLKHKKYA